MNPVASEFDTGGTIEPHRPAIDLHDRPTRAGQACARSRTIVGKAAAAACGAASSRDAHRIGIAPVAHAVAARGSGDIDRHLARFVAPAVEGRPRVGGRRLDDILPVIALVAHRSAAHTSELQSLMRISYTAFCLNKKK